MKRAAAAVVVGLVLAGCGAQSHETPKTGSTDSAPEGAGKPALPDVALSGLGGGKPLELAALRGKSTVINLWASWCLPCREELPLFAKAHRELGDQLRIVGIDFADDAPEAALKLAAGSGVTYPLYADPQSSVKRDLKVVGLPQTVFVDAQGTIVATERRAFRSYADLTTAISKHLGVKP